MNVTEWLTFKFPNRRWKKIRLEASCCKRDENILGTKVDVRLVASPVSIHDPSNIVCHIKTNVIQKAQMDRKKIGAYFIQAIRFFFSSFFVLSHGAPSTPTIQANEWAHTGNNWSRPKWTCWQGVFEAHHTALCMRASVPACMLPG